MVLAEDDVLSISAQAEGTVNMKILDPNGQVVYQNVIKSKLVDWQRSITESGSYTVEVESVALLLNTRVALTVSVLKPNFTYGHPSMDTLISKRSREVLVDGSFDINRKTPKTYAYSLVKGDTLTFSLEPISGSTPSIEIYNNFNELVFAAFSSKQEQFTEIPIFETGTYTIAMSSVSFLAKTNHMKVEVTSPNIYAELPKIAAAPQESAEETPQQLYDTIPEVYMDTVLFLGAKRDIINPNRSELVFKFEQPHTIVKWLVLYGSGKEFSDKIVDLNSLIAGETLAAGGSNVLAAYGLGLIRTLPKSTNGQVLFKPSPSIRWKLKPPLRSNYATVENAYGNHYLAMENLSQSSGQNVYVQVVVFRKMKLESQ